MNHILEDQLKLDYIQKMSQNLNVSHSTIEFFASLAQKDLSMVKEIYKYVQEKKRYSNLDEHLEIIVIDHLVCIYIDSKEVDIGFIKFKNFIAGIIDLFEVVYPLGTVVNLKEEFLNLLTDHTKIEKATFVITCRYIYDDEAKSYYQYGGIPYPIGMIGTPKTLYFTPDLIKEVLSVGYHDHKEDVYVYAMKKELLIEDDYISMGYANTYQQNTLEEKLRGIK